ncbi:uncharacterized protein LOC112494999 isoform X2 [Cephus cinctus]|nr:uncharacterized protein LOC112494999 isoform X2 [Cephus cinctus]
MIFTKTVERNVGKCHFDNVPKLKENFEIPPVTLQQPILDLFFNIIRLEGFLKIVVNEFYELKNSYRINDFWLITALLYVLVYRSSNVEVNDAVEFINIIDPSKMINLLSYLTNPETQNLIFVAGCTIFDIEFVREKLFEPFRKSKKFLQDLKCALRKKRQDAKAKKELTVPMEMNVLNRPKAMPRVPCCTPENPTKRDAARPVPKSTYTSTTIEEKLTKLRKENKIRATSLLQNAELNAPNCLRREKIDISKIAEKIESERRKSMPQKPVSRTSPNFKPVEIRQNATTILREGARIAQTEMKEVQRIKDLVQGAFDPAEVSRIESEMRAQAEDERMRKIIENRLSGLLSHEEALIAKQNLLNEIKTQAFRVRRERESLNAKLEIWRVREFKKIRETVEKSHDIEQASREAQMYMIEEKRQKAAEVTEESRKLRVELCKRKEEDLNRKIRLIQEIKALQSLQSINQLNKIKDFDPTCTSGLGLLCEMSLAELKERLFITKMKIQEDLEDRKRSIREQRQKQKDLIRFTQRTIQEYKTNKDVSTPMRNAASRKTVRDLRSAKIEELRSKLEERRNYRLSRRFIHNPLSSQKFVIVPP